MTICLGDETVTQRCTMLDTDAFDIVIGTDFLRRNPQVKMLTLQRPYSLHCDFGSGLFSVPLELSGRKESGLRYTVQTNYCCGLFLGNSTCTPVPLCFQNSKSQLDKPRRIFRRGTNT